MPIKVLHIITGLNVGGAERMLQKHLASIDPSRLTPSVISLSTLGPMAEPMIMLGVDVTAMGMPSGMSALSHIPRLAKEIRRRRPDVVQTWMYHADLIGGLSSRLAGNRRIAWGVRHGEPNSGDLKGSTRQVVQLCARLSKRIPRKIVCPSTRSKQAHIAVGYSSGNWTIIPNGFDVSHFQPNFDAGLALREELGIKRDAYVVGLVGRYHPSKDIGTFFSAAKIISRCIQDVHFVLAGQGLSEDNSDIADEVNALGSARVHLLGPRGDLDRIYPAFDVLVLSSVAEAFPNVVGEAMASAVPCAVTDVGDCCEIVGSTGRVSPPSDPNGLAAASLEILSMATDARKALGADARQRIVEHYSIEQSATKFTQMYEELSGVCAA